MIGGFGERWNVWPMGSWEAGLSGVGRDRGAGVTSGRARSPWLPRRCRLRLSLVPGAPFACWRLRTSQPCPDFAVVLTSWLLT